MNRENAGRKNAPRAEDEAEPGRRARGVRSQTPYRTERRGNHMCPQRTFPKRAARLFSPAHHHRQRHHHHPAAHVGSAQHTPMSVSTRGPSASTANVSRDYGLLQAPISSVHPAPAIGHDEVEGPAVDDEEHAEALRAVRRYQATGSVFDPHQAPVSEVARSVRPSSSRGQLAERTDSLRAPSRGRQTLSEAASAVSSSSVGGSRDPSLSPSASRNALSPSPTGARPLSFFRSPSRQGGKRLSRYTDCGEGSSLASRYRDLVLGGEPVPPPLEQVQQHFLRQHYPVDPNDPGSAPTHTTAHGPSQAHTTSTRHSINHQNSHATHRNSDYKSFERRWSRSSAVVPRQADVAHVLEQLHLSHASPADIEESAAHHAHERTPLVPSRPTSSYAAPLAPAPGGSGISARTAVPREHAHESHISFIPAHPTVPGPEAFKEELKTISQYTLPIWATHILELSINSITVLVLGHLGTTGKFFFPELLSGARICPETL